MTDRIPTTERLAQALEAENDPRLAEMIERARAGYYDDFKSDLDFPIRRLVFDLRRLGYADLAKRAKAGEFDAALWESEEWMKSDEAQQIFKDLLGIGEGT